MKVKSASEVAQLCPTLSNPMDCSLPGSSVHVIFQASVVEWGAIAFSDSHTIYIYIYIFFSLLLERRKINQTILKSANKAQAYQNETLP